MRGAISKGGSNDWLGAERSWVCGGQGVHREEESEGHEEKYRAVIDGGCPADEPVGQKVGQGRACTMEAKAFSFTHRPQVIADGREEREEQ
jgi:hypothetical protein